PIRVLEVASFYFMFHLQPVGSVAHVQVCGTTSCMICGAEDLMAVCRAKIAPEPYQLSADGKLSWEEVECLGACSNAPMVQIGKDYYEDLTAESFQGLLDALKRGEVPKPGSQTGRWASEPVTGRTSLAGDPAHGGNASVELALAKGDTIARITGEADGGDMQPHGLRGAAERQGEPAGHAAPDAAPHTRPDRKERAERPAPLTSDRAEVAGESERQEAAERQSKDAPARGNNGSHLPPRDGTETAEATADEVMPAPPGHPHGPTPGATPELLPEPRGDKADDLKLITGIGPKLEGLLNGLGIWHFDQIAGWGQDEIAWIDEKLEGFRGRVERDDWVGQAKSLSQGGSPGTGKREL
ncbi:MAG TPA: NAD(P)H-dependent oxidoreductase subunit E, partial [Paracoccaceae bacterium]|nr:NAD(P)H-dependent oxidoreductase subunit E [Paracoccaceae bacterium]